MSIVCGHNPQSRFRAKYLFPFWQVYMIDYYGKIQNIINVFCIIYSVYDILLSNLCCQLYVENSEYLNSITNMENSESVNNKYLDVWIMAEQIITKQAETNRWLSKKVRLAKRWRQLFLIEGHFGAWLGQVSPRLMANPTDTWK